MMLHLGGFWTDSQIYYLEKLIETNALPYFGATSVTKKKSYITLTPGY
jgi:hypothetical protein